MDGYSRVQRATADRAAIIAFLVDAMPSLQNNSDRHDEFLH